MSSIPDLIATALAGVIAGCALAAPCVWRLARALAAARHAAAHDETTGLPNRRALYARLDSATRHGQRVAVAMVDLDGFKTVNDSLGHDAGDQVLTRVAARLSALGAPTMFAARLSGDEFALLIDDRAGDAMLAAHAAWKTIAAAPVPLPDGAWAEVAASVGVAVSRVGADPRTLLHAADLAMYAAKRDGGGVRMFGPDDVNAMGGVAARPVVRPRDRRKHPARQPSSPAGRASDVGGGCDEPAR